MKNLFKNLTALCLSLFLCFGLFGNFKVFGVSQKYYRVISDIVLPAGAVIPKGSKDLVTNSEYTDDQVVKGESETLKAGQFLLTSNNITIQSKTTMPNTSINVVSGSYFAKGTKSSDISTWDVDLIGEESLTLEGYATIPGGSTLGAGSVLILADVVEHSDNEVLAVMKNTYQGAGKLKFVKEFNDANLYNALVDIENLAVSRLNVAKFFDKYFKIYVDPKYTDGKVDVSQSTAMNTKEIFGVDNLYGTGVAISEERVKGEYDEATGSSTFYIYIPNVNMHNVTWDDTNGIITVSEKKFVVVESDWSGGVYSGGGEIEFNAIAP